MLTGLPTLAFARPPEPLGDRRTASGLDRTGWPVHITTVINNAGTAPTGEILAHLNVASIEGASTSTRRIGRRIVASNCPSAGREPKLTWEFQAVNSGRFAAYVVVVPFGSKVMVTKA